MVRSAKFAWFHRVHIHKPSLKYSIQTGNNKIYIARLIWNNTENRGMSSLHTNFEIWPIIIYIHYQDFYELFLFHNKKVFPVLCYPDLYSRRYVCHGPLAGYVKLRVAHALGMPGKFSPPPPVSDPGMHHGTCVTHVPWCMPGSLTSGYFKEMVAKTFPAFPELMLLYMPSYYIVL